MPPTRSDVAVLFGVALPRLGVETQLVGQRLAGAPAQADGAARDAASPASGAAGPMQTTENRQHAIWNTRRIEVAGEVTADSLGAFARPFWDLLGLWRVRRNAHDIVQVRDKIRTGLLMSFYARATGRPFVYWMSFPFVESYEERWAIVGRSRGWVRWLLNGLRAKLAAWVFYRLVAPGAQQLFVQSQAMLESMHRRGIDRRRMTAVPMGVHVPLLQSVTMSAEPARRFPGRRVICYCGVLGRTRQSDFLIEVIRHVRQQVPEALLLLAGDAESGDEAIWIRRRIQELHAADDVWLTGWLSQPQALALMKACEVGLSPIPRGPLYDVSSPTKVVEYLALGIPCVANDIPDQQFVLEQSGGGLCAPMDVHAFAEAVLTLLRDPQGARRMGRRGARWVIEHRSYETIAETVARVYEHLAPSRPTLTATA